MLAGADADPRRRGLWAAAAEPYLPKKQAALLRLADDADYRRRQAWALQWLGLHLKQFGANGRKRALAVFEGGAPRVPV